MDIFPGRMLNRFGKDIETIDSSLAGSLQAVNTALASFFAAIIIIAYDTSFLYSSGRKS